MPRCYLPVLIASLVPFAAEAAAPATVPITGFLTDDVGVPVDVPVDLRVRLYAAPTGGTALFDEDLVDVDVNNGQFTVYVNSAEQSPTFLSLFDQNSQLYVGLAVNGVTEMTPRLAVGSAPYAAYAQYCDDASTLNGDDLADVRRTGDLIDWSDLDATSLPTGLQDGDQDTTYSAGAGLGLSANTFSVDDAYIDGLAKTAAYDTPSELTTALAGHYLANISCPAGNTVMSDGAGGWGCAEGTDLVLDEAVIDGLVADNGFATAAALTALDGRVAATEATNTTQGTQIANLQTGNRAASAPTCNASSAGAIYYNTVTLRFYGCNGTAWARLDSAPTTDIMTTSMAISADSNTGGSPVFTADKVNITAAGGWPSNCIQTSGSGTHWLKVDFGVQRTIMTTAIFGYPGGSHKPTSTWNLEGSNNDSSWTVLGTYDTSFWPADTLGSYPPRPQNLLNVQFPGAYRYYRVIATSWTNGYLLVCNWSMYES